MGGPRPMQFLNGGAMAGLPPPGSALAQLVDFILTRYEAYIVQRLLDFSNGRYTKSLLKNMLPDPSGITPTDVSELPEVGTFAVQSQNPATPSELYTVDIVRGFCSCWIGNSGKLCKHASAVLQYLDKHIGSAYNTVSMDTRSKLFEVALGSTVPEGWLADLQDCSSQSVSMTSTDLPSSSSVGNANLDSSSEKSANFTAQLSFEEQGRLQMVLHRLNAGLASNPDVFVPAVRKMLKNIDHHATTEAGLVSAISTFGKYSGVPPAHRRRFGARIGVQPTAIGRRKLCLSGRRRIGPGRLRQAGKVVISPALEKHDYTSFVSKLPARKRKAPHNLQECVYRDAGLSSVRAN